MAKVVLFSSYLKAGDKGHIQEMLDYIGTREGAVLNAQNEKDEAFKPLSKKTEEKEVTKKQKELIDTIMKKYEDMSELPEYDSNMENQNMFTASLFIAESMKLANELSLNDTVYLKYISERPGAVTMLYMDFLIW